ncbi:hypothetical protein [Kineosporia babensis]|uniref:Alpha-galactosidase CBM13 domain-containing protein n=1 Tax=Kineosporia babensis TaxID=499548 RepID=A0A9X1T4R6_9ACTN|nr:hypothetical protein [Kineosporia babensis]MCD5316918.1 hypothetical protein [Kineosporia babensis]
MRKSVTFKADTTSKAFTALPTAWLWPAGPPIWQLSTLGAAVALTSVAVPVLPTVLPDKPPATETPAAQAADQDDENDSTGTGGTAGSPGSDPTSIPTITGVTPSETVGETPSEKPRASEDVSKPSESAAPEASDAPTPTPTGSAEPEDTTQPPVVDVPDVPVVEAITVAATDALNKRWLVSAVDCSTCASGSRIIGIGLLSTLTVPVNSDSAGTRQLNIAYESKYQRDLYVTVNGGSSQKVTVPGTGSFDEPGWTSVSIDLQEGSNSIKFGNPLGLAPDLDQITIK